MLAAGLTGNDCLRRTNVSLVLLLEIRGPIIARLRYFRYSVSGRFFPEGRSPTRPGVLAETKVLRLVDRRMRNESEKGKLEG